MFQEIVYINKMIMIQNLYKVLMTVNLFLKE